MMHRILLLIFFILNGSLTQIWAQEQTLFIQGQIRSSVNNKPVDGVKISIRDPYTITLSSDSGKYGLITINRPGLIIEYQRLGFRTLRKTLTANVLLGRKNDTLYLDVVLIEDLYTLPIIDVFDTPDTVIGSYRFFIEDYLFIDSDRYLLLTFERNLKAARVLLVDEQEQVLSGVDIPVEVRELYCDYLGNYNVLGQDTAFRIKILPDNRLILMLLPYSDFAARMFPCIDTIARNILFTNYNRNYPAFSYFLYNTTDTSAQRICTITDKRLLDQYNYEFDFLLPKDRLYARKMEGWTGVDKRIIAATMTGFAQSAQYVPLYAPLFLIRDTIYVFDHYRDKLYRYRKQLSTIDSIPINYHHPQNWREWDHQLIKDEITDEVYARYEKNGFYYLKKIDLKTGQIIGSFKIAYPYVKHIRIRNGKVYYIYRKYESTQKKMLYRENIQLK